MSKIPTIRTIKALRGDPLTIDLNKQYSGQLKAQMRKEANSPFYRSFDILANRYLFLSKEKTNDYVDESNRLIDKIEGKWYFDVEYTENVLEPEKTKTIYSGSILFSNDITHEYGEELNELNPIGLSFLELKDTPLEFGEPGQILQISNDGKSIEFVDLDINSIDNPFYNSNIENGVTTTDQIGAIPAGTDIATLKINPSTGEQRTLSEVIDLIAVREKDAYISTTSFINVSGINTSIQEVGTIYSDISGSVSYDRGGIRNGNDTLAGNLTGDLIKLDIKNPDGNVIFSEDSPLDNANISIPNYEIKLGSNIYRFEATYSPSDTIYTNNIGSEQTLLEIDAFRNSLNPLIDLVNINGRYFYYYYLGERGTSPVAVSQIRSLQNKSFLDSSNRASFNLNIPANTPEITVYTVSGRTLSVINLDTTENISVDQTSLSMRDASNNDILYTKNTINLGLRGFNSSANFSFSIN